MESGDLSLEGVRDGGYRGAFDGLSVHLRNRRRQGLAGLGTVTDYDDVIEDVLVNRKGHIDNRGAAYYDLLVRETDEGENEGFAFPGFHGPVAVRVSHGTAVCALDHDSGSCKRFACIVHNLALHRFPVTVLGRGGRSGLLGIRSRQDDGAPDNFIADAFPAEGLGEEVFKGCILRLEGDGSEALSGE